MARVVGSDANSTLMGYISQMDNRLSDRSKREYTSRLSELHKKIQRVNRHAETLTPEMLIHQISHEVTENGIADSTFRMYKSAAMFWIGQQAQALIASGGDPGEYANAYEAIRSLRYASVANTSDRTSGKKLKFFPAECAAALDKYAEERGHRAPNAAKAAAFTKANLLVGLRPSEWFDAAFASYLVRDEEGEIVRDKATGKPVFENMLVVDNAKATHGRGNGLRRELILHEVTAEELTALIHFWEVATKFRARHPASIEAKKLNNLFYRPMNNMIRRALSAVGYATRDIPSIYSTRHQAVADFKASGLDKRVIAAFFGHGSEKTHKEHYGQKKNGARRVTFRPSPESVSKVRVRSVIHRPEGIRQELAAEVERWVGERDARKASPAGGER